MENKHRIIDDQYPMEDTFTKLRERDLKESDELIESSKCSFTNSQQIKKDEDLIGKSSGDTNQKSGSNNNLKDSSEDNHPVDITQDALQKGGDE